MGFSEFSGYEASGMYATHAIENIRTVLAMGKVEYYHEMYMKELKKVTPKIAKKAYTTGLVFGMVEFIMIALWGGNFYFGAYLIEEGRCSFMGMYDALLVILFPAMMVGNIAQALPDKTEALAACRRIFRFIGEDGSGYHPEIEAGQLNKVLSSPVIRGNIEFNNVTFTYPSRPDVKVLENLSFSIKEGETVAFVGASGCGKSTVMALLEQFYRPDSGSITLDGVPIDTIEPSHFRANIGYVAQEPQLFSMTIRENICYGTGEAVSTDVMMTAAKNANAHKFISEFKKGYETAVGEKGLKLSGGQRQRVAIARALIRTKNTKMLLLDEATSALDSKSEEIVQAQLDELMKTRTTVMISHRLSTSQNADRILVFDDGKIIEEGTHTSLVESGGAYAKMVAAQS